MTFIKRPPEGFGNLAETLYILREGVVDEGEFETVKVALSGAFLGYFAAKGLTSLENPALEFVPEEDIERILGQIDQHLNPILAAATMVDNLANHEVINDVEDILSAGTEEEVAEVLAKALGLSPDQIRAERLDSGKIALHEAENNLSLIHI